MGRDKGAPTDAGRNFGEIGVINYLVRPSSGRTAPRFVTPFFFIHPDIFSPHPFSQEMVDNTAGRGRTA